MTRKDYLRKAYEYAAENSTDKSTQTGAVLVDKSGNVVACGANTFPPGVAETSQRFEKPQKYDYVVHAEAAVILAAAKMGVATKGLTMYATWAACNECAKAIITSGISRVVTHKKTVDRSSEKWTRLIKTAREMFEEAGVVYELYDGDIGGVEILFNGQPFQP